MGSENKKKEGEDDSTVSGLEAENKQDQCVLNSSLQGKVFSRHTRVFSVRMFVFIRLAEQDGHVFSRCFPVKQ